MDFNLVDLNGDWLPIAFIVLCFVGVTLRTKDEHGKKEE